MDHHAAVITRGQERDLPPERQGQPDAAEARAANLPGAAAIPPPEEAPPVAPLDTFQTASLPPLWTDRPQAWFKSIESQFAARRITSDSAKFHLVLARLDQDQFVVVEHLADNPPAQNKYISLKESLLSHYADSQERRLRKLFSGLELGQRRPSVLLAEMRRLAGDRLDQAVIKTLWLDRLPRDIHAILIADEDVPLDTLAKLADRIAEVPYSDPSRPHMMGIAEDRIGKLEKALHDLTMLVTERSASRASPVEHTDSRPNTRSRSHGRSGRRRGRSSSTHDTNAPPNSTAGNAGDNLPAASGICYYHWRFGTRANKYTPPCAWPTVQGNEQARQ